MVPNLVGKTLTDIYEDMNMNFQLAKSGTGNTVIHQAPAGNPCGAGSDHPHLHGYRDGGITMQEMRLSEACKRMLNVKYTGDEATAVTGLAVDSRHVRPGDLFFCISGTADDGHRYAEQAVEKGRPRLS